jgi:hypothetical protein
MKLVLPQVLTKQVVVTRLFSSSSSSSSSSSLGPNLGKYWYQIGIASGSNLSGGFSHELMPGPVQVYIPRFQPGSNHHHWLDRTWAVWFDSLKATITRGCVTLYSLTINIKKYVKAKEE